MANAPSTVPVEVTIVRSGEPQTANTQLREPWRLFARMLFAGLSLLLLYLYAMVTLDVMGTPATACVTNSCVVPLDLAAEAQRLDLSLDVVTTYISLMWLVVMPLGYIVIAALIAWHRSADWMALLVSFNLLVMGTYLLSGVNEIVAAWAGWDILNRWLVFVGANSFALLLYLFPNGRFVPRRTYLLSIAGAVLVVVAPGYPAFLTLFAAGLLAQVYRFRQVSSPVQRQQTKWVLFGFASVALDVLIYAAIIINPWISARTRLVFTLGSQPVVTLIALVLPLSIAFSILRYRLWDIDLLINRALVYGALTAILILVYTACVVVLQQFISGLTGEQQSSLVTVVSTLAIAALFQPLRKRIQAMVDRRFYRRKYDAARTLHGFSARLRDEVDVQRLSEETVAVVHETLQPSHVSLWLREDGLRSRKQSSEAN